MKSTLSALLILALVVIVALGLPEGEDTLEAWPIGLTSCPTPSCDFNNFAYARNKLIRPLNRWQCFSAWLCGYKIDLNLICHRTFYINHKRASALSCLRQLPLSLKRLRPPLIKMRHKTVRKECMFLAKKILATNLVLTGALIGTATLTIIAYGCKNKKDSSITEERT